MIRVISIIAFLRRTKVMALPDAYAGFLSQYGIDLRDAFGIADVALDRSETLQAIAILAEARAVILGGDVYLKTEKGLQFARANWFTESRLGESDQSLAARSVAESRDYVVNFEPMTGGDPYFSLVIRED
jgi:hypothetical protein